MLSNIAVLTAIPSRQRLLAGLLLRRART